MRLQDLKSVSPTDMTRIFLMSTKNTLRSCLMGICWEWFGAYLLLSKACNSYINKQKSLISIFSNILIYEDSLGTW